MASESRDLVILISLLGITEADLAELSEQAIESSLQRKGIVEPFVSKEHGENNDNVLVSYSILCHFFAFCVRCFLLFVSDIIFDCHFCASFLM